MKNKVLKFLSIATLALAGALMAMSFNISTKDIEPSKADDVETIDVYFEDKNNWGDEIYCHHWGGATPGTTWCGEQMEYVYHNGYNKPVYKISIPADRTGIIFNNQDSQTSNIESGIANDKCWYLNEGNIGSYDIVHYMVHYNKTHGQGEMASQFVYKYDRDGFKIKPNEFTRTGFYLKTWNTTFSGTGDSYQPEEVVDANKYSSDITLYAQWDFKDGYYLVGLFGDCAYSVYGSVELSWTGTQYEGTIPLEYGNTFRVLHWVGGTFAQDYRYGYDTVSTECGMYKYFHSDSIDEKRIVCDAAATYYVYFSVNDWGGNKHISIERVGAITAEQLAFNLMKYDVTKGTCADRFPECKTNYLSMSEAEQTKFRGYEVSAKVEDHHYACLRYLAWAKALGQKPWEEGPVAVFTSNILANLTEEKQASTIVVVIFGITSSVALVACIYLKKKRTNA